MPDVSIITKSTTGEIHSIVIQNKNCLRAVGVASDSFEWASWIDDSNATFNDVKNCLDFDLQNEFPEPLSTKVLCDIQNRAGFAAAHNALVLSESDSFLRVKAKSETLGSRYFSRTVLLKSDVQDSLYYAPLSEFEDPVAAANFKAHRLITDSKYSAFGMQLKAVRAFFDPDVGPGGGWRCPEGTINGGQITDRFGRGCGGLTRRLGRLLSSLPLRASREITESRKPTDREMSRSRRTLQRAAGREVRRNQRSIRRGEGRAERQAGRVFDREQRQAGDVARGFARTPEYRRQRDEAVAREISNRRANRTTRRLSRNFEQSNITVQNEASRARERIGRIATTPRQRSRRREEERNLEALTRQSRESSAAVRRASGEERRLEIINRREQASTLPSSEKIRTELIENRPWLDDPKWTPEILEYLTDEDLNRLIQDTDIATPEQYQRMRPGLRAIEDGKLAFIEGAQSELSRRSLEGARKPVKTPKEFAKLTDAQLMSEIRQGQMIENFYREYGVFPNENARDQWLKSIAARDLLGKRRKDRAEQIRKIRDDESADQVGARRYNVNGYSENLSTMSNRRLADEALNRHMQPIDGNQAQVEINEAIDNELAARGLTSWTPNTIGRWVDFNPRGGREDSSRLTPDRALNASESDITSHSLIADTGLPAFSWWNTNNFRSAGTLEPSSPLRRTSNEAIGANSLRPRRQTEEEVALREGLRRSLDRLYGDLYDDINFLNDRGKYVNDRIRRENNRRRQVEQSGEQRFSAPDQDFIDRLLAEGRNFIDLPEIDYSRDNRRTVDDNGMPIPFMGGSGSGGQRQRRRRVSGDVSEQSNDMADRPAKRNYFANDSRKLDDPVKTDIIEGRNLQQLEEVMRESENGFTFGRDPSGDFEAAEQFSRAYNAISSEVRQAVRQLQAFDNGELSLSEEEVNDLEGFLIRSKGVLDSELSGFNFAVDVDTSFQMPFGRTVNLGLAHPRFSDDDRSAFVEGRADFIAEAYEAAGDRNSSLAERLRRANDIFDRSSGQRRISVNDEDSRDAVRQSLREAGARSMSDPQVREFFKNEFGVSREFVSSIVESLEGLEDSLRRSDSIDEQIRDGSGLTTIDGRVEAFEEMIRERHFAINEFFVRLLSERDSPFTGQSGQELLQTLRNLGLPEIFEGVNENELRSPNLWREALQTMERNESNLYFNLSDALDSFKTNFTNRNTEVDSVDRHKVLVDVAEGRYLDAAKAIVDKSDSNVQGDLKESLTETVAESLQKMFPKGINNGSLIDRIDQTAAMAGIAETAQPNVVLNESRQAMERRRNIVSLLGQKSQERLSKAVQSAKNRRRSALGSWLERTYGRWDAKPWSDYTDRFGDHGVTPDEIDNIVAEYGNDQRLTAKVDDWIDRVYNVDYQLPNGAVLSSTVNSIYSGSGGLELDGTITLTLPDGTRRDVGEFSRVLGADSFYQSAASTVHNNVLAIEDYDIETGEALPDGWEDDLIKQGIDPATKATTKGSGFATIFNQHAWNWLKDAGFDEISISAGLKDGGYVWGRMGFRPNTRDQVIDFWGKVDKEIFDYEQASDSESTLIKTDLQAAMLKQLSEQAKKTKYDPSLSPVHMEMIMALETDSDDPKARKQEIRNWIYDNKVQLNHGSISLTEENLNPLNSNSTPSPSGGGRSRRRQVSDAATEQSDNMLDPVAGKSGVGSTIYATPPRSMPDELGLISSRVMDPGDVARPREIVNPSIASTDDAVSFVRNGGSLNEVPNEFWPDVLEQNSSSDPNDANALFYSRPVNQGIGGWVSVYMSKNPDGTLSNSGWAVKNSAGRMAFTGRWSNDDEVGRNHSAVFDVLGFNLAATAGLAPHGAGYGGTQKRSVTDPKGDRVEVYVNSTVLPLHLSVLPEGVSSEDVVFPEDADFDAEIFENAKLRAIPQRVGVLLHSWSLGVADRHDGNMSSFVDRDGNGYVFPFDYGLLLERESNFEPERIEEYLRNQRVSFADENLPQEAKEFFASASFDDREQVREQINQTVDRMLDGYASAVNEGFASFSNTAMAGFESTFDRMRQDEPDSDVDFETLAANEKRRIVGRLQDVYDSLEFIVDMRDDIKDQLAELILGE